MIGALNVRIPIQPGPAGSGSIRQGLEEAFEGARRQLDQLTPSAPSTAPGPSIAGLWRMIEDGASRVFSWLQGAGPLASGTAVASTYTVGPGDSLSLIAQRVLGDLGRWGEIYDLNREQIADPNVIHVGQVLKMPGGAPASAPAPAAAPATYTVRSGDTLGTVAQLTLGSSSRWAEVYEANRDTVSNPNLIYPGQVLRVPGGNAPAPAPAPAPAGQWIWPVAGRVSSPFGWRTDPIQGGRSFHSGIDIAAPSGTPIRTPLAGRVVFAGWHNGGGGNLAVIDHGNGLQTVYAHQSALSVSVGQQVAAGAQVGLVGSTGYSTGPHLQFEVKRNGEPIDPMQFLKG